MIDPDQYSEPPPPAGAFYAEGPGYVARQPAREVRKDRAPPGHIRSTPAAPAVMAYRENDWQMDARGRLVPVIVHLRYESGVGCVGRDGDPEAYFAEQRASGMVIIPYDILGPGTDLFVVYDTHRSRIEIEDDGSTRISNQHHATAFQQPVAGPDPNSPVEWVVDAEAWTEFVDWLRVRGVVKQPRPDVVKRLLVRELEKLDDLGRRVETSTDPAFRARKMVQQDRARRAVATLEQELATSTGMYGRPAEAVRSRLRDAIATADRTPIAPVAGPPPPIVPVVGKADRRTLNRTSRKTNELAEDDE